MSYIKEELTDQQRFGLVNRELGPLPVTRMARVKTTIQLQIDMLKDYEEKIDSGIATKRDVACYNDLLEVIAETKRLSRMRVKGCDSEGYSKNSKKEKTV